MKAISCQEDSKIYGKLRERFGTHQAIATRLGVTDRTYRNYRRTGKMPIIVKRYLEILSRFDEF